MSAIFLENVQRAVIPTGNRQLRAENEQVWMVETLFYINAPDMSVYLVLSAIARHSNTRSTELRQEHGFGFRRGGSRSRIIQGFQEEVTQLMFYLRQKRDSIWRNLIANTIYQLESSHLLQCSGDSGRAGVLLGIS